MLCTIFICLNLYLLCASNDYIACQISFFPNKISVVSYPLSNLNDLSNLVYSNVDTQKQNQEGTVNQVGGGGGGEDYKHGHVTHSVRN